ncbi:putative peptidoglycan binding protein [Mumia flava]|uniref:Putative peptidoglycan binding protein n=1 Tax=Mumia flava TaxID=1348852 RepID=A0A2M9BFK5_9ACTN|nr:VanW family protein [Mumia flava]PJJ56728.1 putative peptidoglycan binding protein [Mumia flava]
MLPTMQTPTVSERDRSRGNLVAVLLLLALGLVVLGGYVALHFVLDDRLPVNARIAGVDVGFQTTAEARRTLTSELEGGLDDPVRLTLDAQTYEFTPEEVGFELDVEASVDQTGAGSVWNPLTMIRLLLGSATYPAAVEVDDAALDAQIAEIADAVDRDVVEGRIAYRGTRPVVTQPKSGREVDQERTREVVLEAYPSTQSSLTLPAEVTDPVIESDAISEFVATTAEPAVAQPVTIRAGGKTATLKPRQFAPAVSYEVVGDALEPQVNADRLARPLARATRKIGRAGVDATVEIRSGRPKVVAGRAGIGVGAPAVADALVGVLDERGAARRISVQPTKQPPDVTVKDARGWGIDEKISSFTTNFPYAEYRNVNQGRAASLVNGTILQPGDTFSFNDTVGERTVANGFTTGTMISNGVFREDLGGGVSQVATTLYNAGFFAGLEDVEHKPHSFYISRYPTGREATVAWPTVDLRFKNTLDHAVLIQAWVTPSTPSRQGAMNVVMWGTKQYDVSAGLSARRNLRSPGIRYDPSDRCVPQSGVTGFDVDVYRTLRRGGEVVAEETITAHYNAADTVRCEKAPGGGD